MKPADIREFRSLLRQTLEIQGFIPKKLAAKMPLAWERPGDEVVPFFAPHARRRPWGFHLTGMIAIELRPLVRWMERLPASQDRGIFRFYFAGYHIANDDLLKDFRSILGDDVPIDEWIDRVRQRLDAVPVDVEELIRVYRRAPDHLGWLAAPINKVAWDFLLRWRANDPADLPIPLAPF